jgi:hypothetical protein
MKRRGFLSLLALAPAAPALTPAITRAERLPKTTVTLLCGSESREVLDYSSTREPVYIPRETGGFQFLPGLTGHKIAFDGQPPAAMLRAFLELAPIDFDITIEIQPFGPAAPLGTRLPFTAVYLRNLTPASLIYGRTQTEITF